jgi:hypothetical protein
MKNHIRIICAIVLLFVATLACNAPTGGGSPEPSSGLVNTQVAMAMTQTALGNPPIVPTNPPANPTQAPGLVSSTQVAMAMTQTAISNPPAVPTSTVAQQEQQPTAQDMQTLIDSSNILVYEEMAGYPSFLPVVQRALRSVGGHHKYVGDAMGTFMNELNSGTKWDLIIVAAEARKAISGDYWDVIKTQVDNGSALVAEAWYLDKIGSGKISPLLYECGVDVQKDWERAYGDDRLKFDMYWTDPNSPVFNTPNRVTRFAASLTTPAWNGDIGDFMQLRSGSNAIILASHETDQDQSFGLITSCLDGRMILQTFDSHDYPTNDMIALWNNYIIYTLTNHFLAAK